MEEMTNPQNNKPGIDDLLADFTDQILNEKVIREDETPFASDPELRALEQTALRLRNTFPNDGPSEEVIQRMRNNISAQWQQRSQEIKPFWKKWQDLFQPSKREWQSQRTRQRLYMAVSIAVLAIFFIISIPFLNRASMDQPAASEQNLIAGLLVASVGLVLLAIWLIRRKR
jgi:hypothetical protein